VTATAVRLWSLGKLLVLVALAFCASCASLPEHVDRPVTHAQDGSATRLGGIVSRQLPGDKNLVISGFRLLPTGSDGLDARLALAGAAERTLDVQYYLISVDDTGKQFFSALRDAASRGVRVRLLLDDLYTIGEDDMLAGLASYPNVEIRLFNPFTEGRGLMATRMLLSAGELGRVNRRMHNKLFIADNQMAISGGRNVANEYFSRAGNESFVDLDVLSVGPIVASQSGVFDEYWNSSVVYPLFSIISRPADGAAARATFDHAVAGSFDSRPIPASDLLGLKPVSEDLKSGDMELHQAIGEVLADSPEKAAGLNSTSIRGTVTWSVDDEIKSAKESLLFVSPYFIPGKTAMAGIKAAVERGVQVTVVTNSLGATDVPLVYAGYKKPRYELLKMGVKIYELSEEVANAHVKLGDFRSQLGRLHAKAVVVDKRHVFIGSMNMDGRSAHENTETGIILGSQTIGAEVAKLVDLNISRTCYEVRLDGDQVRWVTNLDGKITVFDEEQGVSMWTRMEIDLLGPLAPTELL
jgi:putative cardiolipin synthase